MMTAPFIGFEGAMGQLAAEVQAVEEILRDELRCQVETVEKVGLHTLDAGGKRLRPALVITAAKATGRDFDLERARKLGACLEMVHMATLIHDDVIDHSATRRGKPTAAAVFGNTASILSGDVLLSKAMAILAEDGDIEIIRSVSAAVMLLAQGEVHELEHRNRIDLTEAEHRHILEMKTASLIACCCEVGARVAGADASTRESLKSYGYHLGMAFQIVDDLLDYRGKPNDTGKPKATDFVEGCATLPIIYLMPLIAPEDRAKLGQGFGKSLNSEDLDRIMSLMDALGVFKKVDCAAAEHGRLANEALEGLPETQDRDLLKAVSHFVLGRDR